MAGDSLLRVVERTVSFGESSQAGVTYLFTGFGCHSLSPSFLSQDVMTALGAPGKVFYKDEDKVSVLVFVFKIPAVLVILSGKAEILGGTVLLWIVR